MLEYLIAIDKKLFVFIHFTLGNSFFDFVIPYIRDARFWIPLYVFILWQVFRFDKKIFFYFILTALILVTLTDQISASFFKPFFERLRPCHDPSLTEFKRELINCGGLFGFISSHATNHFGLAVLFAFFFRIKKIQWIKSWYFYVWAGIICFGQVYVGKHFPGDVLVGGIIGILIGWMMVQFFQKISNIDRL